MYADWTRLHLAIEARHAELATFYALQAARPVTTTTTPRQQTEQSQHAAHYDGDRFDRLASCESGDGQGSINPQAVSPGGKYRGAFQFSLPSWHSAGMAGDPIDFSYVVQKETAIYWASITTPSTQWPVCWPRSG